MYKSWSFYSFTFAFLDSLVDPNMLDSTLNIYSDVVDKGDFETLVMP